MYSCSYQIVAYAVNNEGFFMGTIQGPYILQLCMGPSYFWGSDHSWPPLFCTLSEVRFSVSLCSVWLHGQRTKTCLQIWSTFWYSFIMIFLWELLTENVLIISTETWNDNCLPGIHACPVLNELRSAGQRLCLLLLGVYFTPSDVRARWSVAVVMLVVLKIFPWRLRHVIQTLDRFSSRRLELQLATTSCLAQRWMLSRRWSPLSSPSCYCGLSLLLIIY